MDAERKIAYFSMEIGLEAEIPTYSGGLGILAGDTVRSAADLKIPMVMVTLLHRKGYFYQRLGSGGEQMEEPVEWVVEDFMQPEEARVTVRIENRTVHLRAWKYEVKALSGFTVPVYFLDADLQENSEEDRELTDFLYGGELHYRLSQEIILGIGGVRMLRALGYENIERFHMNEGHASLLTLELLQEQIGTRPSGSISDEDIDAVKKKCVFTTHTPVPAGHDKFPIDMARQALGEQMIDEIQDIICCDGTLNMTYLALSLSHYINGVAKKHGEISRHMYTPYVIDSITNGIHPAVWVSGPFQKLFDKFIPGWREDNFNLRYALNIRTEQVWQAHMESKRKLISYVNRETNTGMDNNLLTIGFARRTTTYKRADLLFTDIARLKNIASNTGPFQLIYAGKAHPRDEDGKKLIRRIFRDIEQIKPDIKAVYLQNYDIELGKLMTAGVDLWLNTPEPPLEASGTSGMKAAINGVPSFSILDGWWIEGCIENITGWAIGKESTETKHQRDSGADAKALYEKLERVIVPMFYENPEHFQNIMLHCIALNGSFFNTQRMMQQYVLKAYFS